MVLRGAAAAVVVALALPAAAAAVPMVVAQSAGGLSRFDSSDPATLTPLTISPAAAPAVRGIDWRPRTGDLVYLSRNGGLDAVVLTPGATTGTFRNSGSDLTGTAPFDNDSFHGVDVNPVVDRVRVTQTGNGANLRLHPDTGLIVSSDSTLNPAGFISAVAYSPGQSPTLYGVDDTSDQLVRIGGPGGSPSPNGGAVTAIGSLGVDTVHSDLDIAQDGSAFASLIVGTTTSLYRVDLATGQATPIGAFPFATEGLAVLPAGVLELDAVAPVTEGGFATVTVRRRDGGFGAVSVDVGVVGGTASAADVGGGGRVTFAEGETVKTIQIATTPDTAFEGAEDATVQLVDPLGGATLGAQTAAPLVIRDDDPAPQPTTTTTTVPGPTRTIVETVPLGPDRVAPVVLAVPPDRIRLAALRRSGLPFMVGTTEAGTLTAELRARTRVLGRVTQRLAGPSARRLRIRLTAAGRRALRRPRRLVLFVRAVDAAGNAATRSVGLRVTR